MEGIPKTLGREIRFNWLVILISGIALAAGPGTESWLFWVALCFFTGGTLIWLPILYWTQWKDREGLGPMDLRTRNLVGICAGSLCPGSIGTEGTMEGRAGHPWSCPASLGLPVSELLSPRWLASAGLGGIRRDVWSPGHLDLPRTLAPLPKDARHNAGGSNRAARVYQRGRYLGFGKRYTLAGLEYQPGEWPELIFKLLVRQRYGASLDAVRIVPSDVHVLVPADRQADALALVERCRQQMGTRS